MRFSAVCKIIAAILISFFLQIRFVNFLEIFGIKPNLLFLTTIFYALRARSGAGLFCGFLCGFLQDTFSNFPLGSNMLIFGVCGFFVGKVADTFYEENTAAQIAITALSALLAGIMQYIILNIFFGLPSVFVLFFRIILPSAVYTTLTSIFFFGMLEKLGFSVKDQLVKRTIIGI